MNRSFPSIAALLVSLSGAILAVTWIPKESPRPVPNPPIDRKRAAAVPCGFLAGGNRTAFHPRQSVGPAAGDGNRASAVRTGVPKALALDLAALVDRANIAESAAGILPLPALESVRSALGSQLSPLWPLLGGAPSDDSAAEADLPSAPRHTAWLTPIWRRATQALQSAAVAGCEGEQWSKMYKSVSEEILCKYDRIISDCGLHDPVAPLLAHLRRQHQRLALREALLKELDRHFLNLPIDRDYPRSPPKPQYRGPSRKLMLAAADALKSLSQTLEAAAERLEEASRHDVAELHSPSENR